MTTQYTTILKLALPVQGELSGTWGDVVNDNITQMVEQAVAGKAVVNTWTGNSHTLTTADGTTSESRCAILELTDSGTALTGAGTVVCPTNTKLYIVDNNTAQIVTVKTSGGTGVAVPVGKTMLVYCDGTNVVEGVTHANSLSLGTSTNTVNAISIATDLGAGGSSNSNLPTQLAVKTYVDGQIAATNELSEVLAAGNVTGANDIDVENAQKVQFRDAAIYINSSVDGQLDIVADGEVQIDTALVDINGNLDVSGTTNISGSVSFTKNAIAGVAISTTSRSSNTVTVTTSAVHGLTSGDLVNVNGVANRSFNGYFTVSVSSTTVFTYSQTGADESSTGGTSTEVVYNLNASGTALNQMNGPLNIAANSGIDGLEITQSGAGNGLHVTGTTGLVGNVNVTGSVTADGLTVDGLSAFNATATFSDGSEARFGDDNDMALFHSSGVNHIRVNSGIFKLRADDMRFTAQNGTSNKLTLDSNGDISFYEDTGTTPKFFWDASAEYLGIGTSSPSATLNTVSDTIWFQNAAKSYGIGIYADDANSSTKIRQINSSGSVSINTGSGGANQTTFDSSGNVGIGTSTPDANLEVLDPVSGNFSGEIRVGGTGSSRRLLLRQDSATEYTIGASGSGALLKFATGDTPTEAMRIDSSGNVGIGTSSPSEKLQVDGNIRLGDTATGTNDDEEYSITSGGQLVISANDSAADVSFSSLILNAGKSGGAAASSSLVLIKTNDAERMRIDASGNVAIGTTTVNSKFNVASSQDTLKYNEGVTVFRSTGSNKMFLNCVGGGANIVGSNSPITFNYHDQTTNNVTEAMRIVSGNVGIGTSSPASPTGFGTGGILHLKGSTGNDCSIVLEGLSGSGGRQEIGASGGALQFYRGAATGSMSESMRLDSAGNLLVGKTAANFTVAGHEIKPASFAGFTRDSGTPVVVNRLTNDGALIELYSGATSVGSIGAKGGTAYLIGSSKGLRVSGSGLIPITTAGANSDATYDIGDPSVRFKDLYLSGGVYLGGTGAANKLDDYEEGTFTPVLSDASTGGNLSSYSNRNARYTKVGRMVTIVVTFINITTTGMTASNLVYLQGLPFSVVNVSLINFVGSQYATGITGAPNTILAGSNSTSIYTGIDDVSDIASGTADYYITLTYEAA
jgi:hypothetical protein